MRPQATCRSTGSSSGSCSSSRSSSSRCTNGRHHPAPYARTGRAVRSRRPSFSPPHAFPNHQSPFLTSLESCASSSCATVFNTPLSAAELRALRECLAEGDLVPPAATVETLQAGLLPFLQDAAARGVARFQKGRQQQMPDAARGHPSMAFAAAVRASNFEASYLEKVHGAMAVLEQVHKRQQVQHTPTKGAWSDQEMADVWQLVVGGDAASPQPQFIPVLEEMEVGQDNVFSLHGDLSPVCGLFTDFTGTSRWLSPGHLQYKVSRVRIELRRPLPLVRALKTAAAQRKVAGGGGAAAAAGGGNGVGGSSNSGSSKAAAEPDDLPCRPDADLPALTVPLPFFPANDLYVFASDGRVACARSRLGGLILMANQSAPAQQPAAC